MYSIKYLEIKALEIPRVLVITHQNRLADGLYTLHLPTQSKQHIKFKDKLIDNSIKIVGDYEFDNYEYENYLIKHNMSKDEFLILLEIHHKDYFKKYIK